MKKLRYLVIALAAVAMIGLSSCKTKVKEEAKEVTNTEAVEESAVTTDSAAMAAPMDSTAAKPEETPAE